MTGQSSSHFGVRLFGFVAVVTAALALIGIGAVSEVSRAEVATLDNRSGSSSDGFINLDYSYVQENQLTDAGDLELIPQPALRSRPGTPIPRQTQSPAIALTRSPQLLPSFVLPYSASENGRIRWTGGPHAYGLLDGLAYFPSGEGSGLDFARDDHGSFGVLAMAEGTVEQASCDQRGMRALGFGCSVAVRHTVGDSVMVYGHLASFDVNEGDAVDQGDVIGQAGTTGADNLHLHIELRDGAPTCNVRCLPNNQFGNPIGWDDLVELVDGYRIGGYIRDADGDTSWNYDGSAVKGNVKVVYDFRYLDCDSSGSCNHPQPDVIARVHSAFQCTDPVDCEINSPPNASEGTQFAGHGVFNADAQFGVENLGMSPDDAGGILLSSNLPLPPPIDLTPPSASSFTAQASDSIAQLRTSGVQDNPGGSGVREVRFSAKWSGTWYGVGVSAAPPYSLDWNMCTSGVPDGDVELGMEVWDNAGNRWVWSEHYPNPHITKSYNCAPPPPSEGVYLYRNTGQSGGSCYFTQDAPSIGNYCQSAGYGGGWNDDAESVRVQGSYYFALYRDDNYSGGEPLTGNPTGDLPAEWRNQASSIRIRRNDPARFTLYDLGDYNGESFASDRTIFDFGHWAFNDRAESIRVAAGYEVIVCADSDFHGICGRTTSAAVSDINAVAQGLRNAVSSVRVCQGGCPATPNSPTLSAPHDNTVLLTGQNILFQWSGNGVSYLVKLWGGELASPMESGWRNGMQWSPGTLAVSNNPYYWQVKAWNDYGESGWSSTWSFYVHDALPDLFPYAPPGYSGPVVFSSEAGTFVSGPVTAGELTYFDWHVANGGTAGTSSGFYVDLLIDDQNRGRFPLSGLDRNQVGGMDDWSFTVNEAGWHTIKLVVDPLNMVAEANESNNEWITQYYWDEPVGTPYDVDHDLDVDILDVQLVAAHWGCNQGDTCYNSIFDINQSGGVDIQDIVEIALHWNCRSTDLCYQPPSSTPTPTSTPTSTPSPTATPTATPPASPRIELVGQTGGLSYAVATQGTIAYVGFGWQLTALNIADPSNPILMSRSPILSGVVKSIAISGNYAYVAASTGAMDVVDISNPNQLLLVGSLDSPGSGEDIVVAGSYAYLADGISGLRIINISNPSSPSEIGNYSAPSEALGVSVLGTLAYVADNTAGLRILNIATPNAPVEIGYVDTPGNAQDVMVVGQYAYVADNSAGLRVIDVSTPTSPLQVGSFLPLSPLVTDLTVSGQYAFLANSELGLTILDISNPSNPTEVGGYDTPGTTHGVIVTDNDAYVADRYGLRVLNVSVPSAVTERSSVQIAPYWYVDSQGNTAFATDSTSFKVIDLSDPLNPVVMAQLLVSTYSQPFEVEVAGNYAYVAGSTDGLFVIDISVLESPVQVGFLSTPYSIRDLEVVGHYAYVLSYPAALHVIDIADPQFPIEVGAFSSASLILESLTVANDKAYVITSGCGASLMVIDVSNPVDPHPVGSTLCISAFSGMLASGDLVYVGLANGTAAEILVVDASDPTNLHVVGSCTVSTGYAQNLLKVGRYLYVGSMRGPVGVVDLINPTSPSFVVATNIQNDQNGEMAAVGANVAVINWFGGLSIVHFSDAEPPVPH